MNKSMTFAFAFLAVAACGGNEMPATAPAAAAAGDPAATTASGTDPAAKASPTSAAGTPIADADKVIAEMRADFRTCYNDGLKKNAKLEGGVVIEAKVGPKGDVTSATPQELEGLTPEVGACIAKRVQKASFTPPGEKGSTLRIPVKFKPGS